MWLFLCWINEYILKARNLLNPGASTLKESLINTNLEHERSWLMHLPSYFEQSPFSPYISTHKTLKVHSLRKMNSVTSLSSWLGQHIRNESPFASQSEVNNNSFVPWRLLRGLTAYVHPGAGHQTWFEPQPLREGRGCLTSDTALKRRTSATQPKTSPYKVTVPWAGNLLKQSCWFDWSTVKK